MLKRLIERLDALANANDAIRDKLDGKKAQQLDGLAVAKVLLAVDGAVKKLAKLNDELKPDLFDGKESA